VDLKRQFDVEDWIASRRPRIVFLTADRAGGLYAHDAFPADFLYDKLLIETNIIQPRSPSEGVSPIGRWKRLAGPDQEDSAYHV